MTDITDIAIGGTFFGNLLCLYHIDSSVTFSTLKVKNRIRENNNREKNLFYGSLCYITYVSANIVYCQA